ncbi:hypothetical protein [Rhodoferax sp.]|uniref:hypothetical protein n=1 Tax=Rhodoferax sp. TaxID=50421 RepID=UPI0008BA3D56|nr:hypothetical protein [Rhodoferax sp.]MDO8320775.1 hypothetical protein [Rhodoferax sp.]MDP2679228.1 hypothetical protein [Rhodoferax sp.]OGB82408.1 MAG: hypothetical protein A2535_04365 [Burkholderiales bacterium RIFOXYD2_FULL_59_8]
MPYYIYRVKPFAQLDQLSAHASFAEASGQAKTLRLQPDLPATDKIKVIFADTPLQAEDLLCQVRTAGPKGDD